MTVLSRCAAVLGGLREVADFESGDAVGLEDIRAVHAWISSGSTG